MIQQTGIAIIGTGIRSHEMFGFLKQHADEAFIAGVYDTVPSRCELLLQEHGIEGTIYKSLAEALTDERVTAVFVGTPDNLHADIVVAALQAGKHVYCEKPMATTLADCERMIAAAQQSKGIFYLGMNLRHSPFYEKINEIIQAGKLGRILTVEANEYYYGGRTYFLRWNRNSNESGGLWITKSVHDFDLLNWLIDSEPVRVFASAALDHYQPRPDAGTHCRACPVSETCPDYYDIKNPEYPIWDRLRELTEQATGEPRDLCLYNSDKDTIDNGIAVIDYKNGVRASYTMNVVSSRTTRQMRINGTHGALEADCDTGIINFYPRHGGREQEYDLSEEMKSSHGGSDVKIFGDFFHCCRTGARPRSTWKDGRLSLMVGLAATKSTATHQPVDLEQLEASPLLGR